MPIDEIWVLGDIFVDIQASVIGLPSWNSDTTSKKTELLPGGSAANAARQLHSLCSSVGEFKPQRKSNSGNGKLSPRRNSQSQSDSPRTKKQKLNGPGSPRNSNSKSPKTGKTISSNVKQKPVRFFSTVGGDEFGRFFKRDILQEAENWSDNQLKDVEYLGEGIPTSTCIVLSGKEDRAFVSCNSSTAYIGKKEEGMKTGTASPTNRNVFPGSRFWTAMKELGDKRKNGKSIPNIHLHIGGFFNLEGFQDALLDKNSGYMELLKDLKTAGKNSNGGITSISLATQFDAADIWTGKNGCLWKILEISDILFVNMDEYKCISSAWDHCHTEAVNPLLSTYSDLLVVETRGEAGSQFHIMVPSQGQHANGSTKSSEQKPKLATDRSSSLSSSQRSSLSVSSFESYSISFPVQKVQNLIDTTGAGDAFLTGFLFAYAYKCDKLTSADEQSRIEVFKGCIPCANEVATKAIMKVGACRAPANGVNRYEREVIEDVLFG